MTEVVLATPPFWFAIATIMGQFVEYLTIIPQSDPDNK
jgi:hypothetical protein